MFLKRAQRLGDPILILGKCASPGSEAWQGCYLHNLGSGGPLQMRGWGRENDQTTQWTLSMGQKTIWV